MTVLAVDGTTTSTSLLLFTTLLDHRRYPAAELTELYHRRWQAETAYFGLKITLRGADRVLRAYHTDDAQQELFGLLVVYQAARQIVVDAALHAGITPSRISLAVTIRTARHTVITATGTTTRQGCRPTPVIRHAVLHPREPAPPHQNPAPPRQAPTLDLRLQHDQEKHPDPQREDRHNHHHNHGPNTRRWRTYTSTPLHQLHRTT